MDNSNMVLTIVVLTAAVLLSILFAFIMTYVTKATKDSEGEAIEGEAVVLSKRDENFYYDPGSAYGYQGLSTFIISYYVTFQFIDGATVELQVEYEDYIEIEEGERGFVVARGIDLISFTSNNTLLEE